MKASRAEYLIHVILFSLPLRSLATAGPVEGRDETGTRLINLVQNPSFERPDAADPEIPAGFTPGRAGGGNLGNVKLTRERVGLTGEQSVAVETLESSCIGYWETVVPVKPLAEYALSFYYKCRSAAVPKTTLGDPQYNKSRPGGPNLELGVAPEDESALAKPTHWTDIGMALGPVGGTYLPLATEWSLHRQTIKTEAGQTKMRVKLRLYCYAQKVWFDDLSVVEAKSLPKLTLLSPTPGRVVKDGRPVFQWKGPNGIGPYLLEYSTSPTFSRGTAQRLHVKGERLSLTKGLTPGTWFWHVGTLDQESVPCWLAGGSFDVGGKPWSAQDTTPPTVNLPTPPPGVKTSADVTIAAKFSDTGAGVNVSSARILLDGEDVTRLAKVTDSGFVLQPAKPLSSGVHRVAVVVADRAGNSSNRLMWQFGVETFAPMTRRFDRGVFLADAEPYFPIGIYAYVCTPTDGRFKESALAQAAAAGFDCLLNTTLVTEAGDSVADLDILSKHGMRCLLNISADMKSCGDLLSAKTALIDKGQGQFRDHSCVLGYWGDDPENLDNTEESPTPQTTIVKIENARQILKRYSPDHPVVWAISNLPRLKDCVPTADVLLSYRYPVPQFHPKMIYDWTLNYVYSVVGDKLIWFNSQGFDLGYGSYVKSTGPFRPTPQEMRAMAYYSLVEGVRGYTLYGCSLSEESQPAHWKEALRLATEMRYLSPALAAGKPASTAVLKANSTSSSIFFREIEHERTHTLIAVNLSGGTIAAEWGFGEPTRAVALFEDRSMTRKLRGMRDLFGPYEVHVYRW